MHRIPLFLVAVAATLATAATPSPAQSTGCSDCVRVRVRTPRDSAGRARSERLLLKFDSLRFLFENERLSDAERERISSEMHLTVMALQESLDDVGARSGALARSRTIARASEEAERMATPEIAIAMQSGYSTRGYLGVSFDGPSIEMRRGNERIIRFLDYPKIAMVEPSSPAERAGIREGDTLLALNGNDVRRKEFSLTKLLVPDQRVVVRVQRDGDQRDFRVRIGEAPGYVMSRMAPTPPMPPMPSTPVRVYPGEDLPRRVQPAPAVAMPSMSMPPQMPGSVWIINDGVGGAKLETINEGLAKTIGVKSGVLVLRVGPGTPAFRSGLRDGDVILRASGRQVSSVRELRELVERENEDGVKLVIQRDRKQRELTLRW